MKDKGVRTLLFLLICIPTFAEAQAPSSSGPAQGSSTEDLQKATQNPVASLISVPLQNNSNFNVQPGDRTQNVLNIQPVIPIGLSENWNLISRIITPIIYQPTVAQPVIPGGEPVNQGAFGFGDVNPTFFLSPAKPRKIIWGVGPAFVLPTATNPLLGQGKWSIGPSVVALAQPKHWTIGVLVNNVWSFAGQSQRLDVNQMLLQYFINYNLSKGWFLTSQPIITANWEVSSPNRWTVPFGAGVGRIMRLGAQPVNLGLQFYGVPVRPNGASAWGMRIQIAFLFPKAPKK